MIGTTGLEAIAEAMQLNFRESGCPATIRFGAQYLTEHVEELRVIFVPTKDTYGAPLPVQARGRPPGPMSLGANPRPVLTRYQGAELHLWAFAQVQGDPTQQVAADFALLAALINQTLLSLHRANPGNYTADGGETLQKLLWANRGVAYRLNIRVQVPIVDVAWNQLVNGLTWTEVTGVTGAITVNELDASVTFEAGPTGPTGP